MNLPISFFMRPDISESLYLSLQAHDIMVNQNNGFERVVFASDVTPPPDMFSYERRKVLLLLTVSHESSYSFHMSPPISPRLHLFT